MVQNCENKSISHPEIMLFFKEKNIKINNYEYLADIYAYSLKITKTYQELLKK